MRENRIAWREMLILNFRENVREALECERIIFSEWLARFNRIKDPSLAVIAYLFPDKLLKPRFELLHRVDLLLVQYVLEDDRRK